MAKKKATKKAAPKVEAAPKAKTPPKVYGWEITSENGVIRLSRNLTVSNDGRKGTVKINDALAERLQARGKGNLIRRVSA